jgi:hypothetical protein
MLAFKILNAGNKNKHPGKQVKLLFCKLISSKYGQYHITASFSLNTSSEPPTLDRHFPTGRKLISLFEAVKCFKDGSWKISMGKLSRRFLDISKFVIVAARPSLFKVTATSGLRTALGAE